MLARLVLLSIPCTILPFLLCPSLHAQNSGIIGFRRLSVDEGLSQSTVNCVTQDRDGFLWFGTQDGLNKYDGYACEVFRKVPGDTNSLSDDYITALLADTQGKLWIGTYSGGVNCLDPPRGFIRRYALRTDSLLFRGSRSVMAIAEDSSGSIWVATWGGGLDRLDPRTGAWAHCRYEQGGDSASARDRATSMAVDRQGRLWLGTWDGLHQFDPATGCLRPSIRDTVLSIEDRKIMAVCCGGDGTVWYGTFSAGLFRLDTRSRSLTHYTTGGQKGSSLSSMSVRSILEDGENTLWVGTWGGGIDLLEEANGAIRPLSAGPSPALSIDQVLALCADRSGGVWVGLDGAGVNHYDPSRFKFRHIRCEPGNHSTLRNSVVRALCEDRSGHIWVGEEGGSIDCLDPATGRVLLVPSSGLDRRPIGTKTILALLEDRDGYLWAGTDGEGLHRLDPARKKWQNIPLQRFKDEMIGPDHVIWLCEAKDGWLWAGTLGGGAFRMNRRTLEHHRYMRTSRVAPGQLSGNYVYCLLEDRAGKLWIGTWGAGISVLDPHTGSFVNYQHDEANPRSLAQNSVLAFHEDGKGTIWVATLGGGLDAFDPTTGSFVHTTEADGLPNGVINGVLEDRSGNLWLSTNKGISCFNPGKRTFRNYDVGDGLQGMEFNQGAFCATRDGRFFFGGVNGVSGFVPADLPVDSLPPPVLVTRCTVFDRPLQLPSGQEGLTLSHDQNFVSFEFVALDFTAPEKNAYSYMVEGLDRDWVLSGSRRYASYTNLPSGDYVFRVRASNNDGIWNTTGASLGLHVSPPFWGTSWFRVLALLLVVGSGYGLYRRRINQLEHERQIQADFSQKLNESQETERKRIAGELHDGLGQELLTIKNRLNRLAGSEHPAARAELADVETSVHRAIEEVRQISADLHPHMLERLGLTRTIESMIRRTSEAACLKILSSIEQVDGLFCPNEEINVYRILQEALTNVVKHSQASQCTVHVERRTEEVCLTVQDDGCGFAPNAVITSEKAGLGLVNMAERVRMLHGDMEVRSAPGTGTTLRFHIPFSGAIPANPLTTSHGDPHAQEHHHR